MKKINYKPGDRVMIYTDPVTQEAKEGEAILLQRLIKNSPMEYWRVKFTDGIAHRWIKVYGYIS